MTLIQRAVWSHWSKPLEQRPGAGWPDLRHYLQSFVLSYHCVRRMGLRTALVTDTAGAELFVEGVGLAFDSVSTELDKLPAADAHAWNRGKVEAYRSQEEPFLHLDIDVYLWRSLPERLLRAPLLAQNPEYATEHPRYYHLDELEQAIVAADGWLPEEWWWCRRLFHAHQRAFNTGIYGGHALEFIRHGADLYLDFLNDPANATVKASLPPQLNHMGALEMLLPAMALDFHRDRAGSQWADLSVQTLFADAHQASIASNYAGYTHLLGAAKHDPRNLANLDARVARDHPEEYKRCNALVD